MTDRDMFIVLASVTLGFAVAALWLTRSFNPLRGDSAQYLYFDPSRTVGYPAFLEFIRLLTGRVALAVPVQMLLLALCLFILGWSFHRLFNRPAYSIGFQLLLTANAGMWLASAFLMTEALSTALVALWGAQVLRMMRRGSGGYRELVAISCMATMVRPSLLPLFFGAALFALVGQPARDRPRIILMTAAGVLAAWVATPLAQFVVHGSAQTSSPLARGVLQHTLYCEPRAAPQGADATFIEATARPVRRYIDAAPPSMQEQFRREYSTPLRFGAVIPLLGRRHHLEAEWQVDSYLAPVAEERLLANPGCYARSVANEYLRLATFDTDPTDKDANEVNAFAREHPPVQVSQYPVLPGEASLARQAGLELHRTPAGLNPRHAQLHVKGDVPLIALLPLRVLYAAAAMIGGAAIVILLGRRRLPEDVRPLIRVAAAFAVGLHGILAITAMVEIGFYRYLVPCWPLACTLVGLATSCLRRAAPFEHSTSAATEVARTRAEILGGQ